MNGMATDIYFYLKDKEEDKDNNTITKGTISIDIKTLPFDLVWYGCLQFREAVKNYLADFFR